MSQATVVFAAFVVTFVALHVLDGANALSGGPYYGDGTHYGKGQDYNGWCKGFGKGNGWPGLPTVAMNAEQFENGGACGICISGYGTGKGAGYTPIYGALDFCDDGDGRWQIIWYVVDCKSHGRHLLENNITVNTYLDDIISYLPRPALSSQLQPGTVNGPGAGVEESRRVVQTRRMLHLS